MIHLNDKTRELTSDTGYIRSKDGNLCVDYPIYIAKSETEENYEEATKEEYEAYLKAKEEEKEYRATGRINESQNRLTTDAETATGGTIK